MKTVIEYKFLDGEKITVKPNKKIKCYRCKKNIKQGGEYIKIASIFALNYDDKDALSINWTWLCKKCNNKLQGFLENKS